METQKPLLKDEDGEEVDVHMYRLMIGSLMYLTSSRPNIMFAVCACARYQVNPKVSHLYAMKRIFRYLKGQLKLGLWYPKDSPFDLLAYTDSDYAGASLDRKSTTGEKAKKSVRLMMEKLIGMEFELMLVSLSHVTACEDCLVLFGRCPLEYTLVEEDYWKKLAIRSKANQRVLMMMDPNLSDDGKKLLKNQEKILICNNHEKEENVNSTNNVNAALKLKQIRSQDAKTHGNSKDFVKDEDVKEVDFHKYRSMIGSLMYLHLQADHMFDVCTKWSAKIRPLDPKTLFTILEANDSDYARASKDRSLNRSCQFLEEINIMA
ncbi:hypothetical protein Tco_0689598 [Tanacetum coccineum]